MKVVTYVQWMENIVLDVKMALYAIITNVENHVPQ
jgi:hypothetical protein